MKKFFLIFLVGFLFVPVLALAKIGVGVGTGKIQVDQKLTAGLIYSLPPFSVINTGDEPAQYKVFVQHRQDQSQLVASPDWFSFSPETFSLDPGKVQVVKVSLNLPIQGVEPGDYFGLLTAQPVIPPDTSGGTTIGVAAAAKLYFTVAPANIFVGIYYRTISLIKLWSPWSYIALVVVGLAILLVVLRRFVSFNIGISVRKKKAGKK